MKMKQTEHSIVILSGGLDSTVALWQELELSTMTTRAVTAVTVDYGQRHRREIQSARAVIEHYQTKEDPKRRKKQPVTQLTHIIVDARGIGHVLPGSALTDQTIPVPRGHYAARNMASTIVPNRNMIIASIAAGIGMVNHADRIILGIHAGDHAIYPDCRMEFALALENCIRASTGTDMQVITPFLHITKSKIVKIGVGLDAPLELTWSCYQGKERHCGRCGTCVERNEAFTLAGIADPTEYRPERKL